VIDARAIDVGVFDFGCGGGPSCALDKVCCTMPGPPLTFGCVDPGACTANEEVLCDGPDECVVTPSTPVCCGIEKPDGTGTFPQCGTSAISTSCTTAAACPTHLSNSCSQTSKVQICHMSSECTDPNNNMCCTFMSGGASLSFCIDSLTASLGGGTCN
jgi:hypothetical protein